MKGLLPVFFVLLVTSSYAQLEKGSKLVGLQTNLKVNDMYSSQLGFTIGSSVKHYGISLIPTFGYALKRNWLIGAQATFGLNHVYYPYAYSTYSQKENYTDLGIAPFTRLYLDVTKNKKWKLFAVAALEFVNTRSTITYTYTGGSSSSTTSSNSSTTGSIGGGLGYFGRRLSVDLSLSNTALRLGFYKILVSKK